MSSLFSEFVESVTPKFNPYIVNGYARYMLDNTKSYLFKVIRSAIAGFKDLQLVSIQDVTPEEELHVLKSKGNRFVFNIAKSSLRMLKIEFTFKGELLPAKYFYIPYIEEAATLYINDALYHITPILGDKVITKTPNGLFIRLIKDKILVNRYVYTILYNGDKKSINVLWAQIYRTENSSKAVSLPKTSLVHYLLSHYGFTEFFKRYFGFVPIVQSTDVMLDPKLYESSVIIESTGIKPKMYANVDNYEAPKIRFIIGNSHVNKDVVDIIGTIIYILDMYWYMFGNVRNIDNKDIWAITLGKIIKYGKNYSNNKILSIVNDHFAGLKTSLDEMIKDKLIEINFECEDFYDLIGKLVSSYSTLNSIFGVNNSKYLEVLYYVLYTLTEKFYRFSFALNKNNGELTKKLVIDELNKHVSMNSIYKLRTSNNICEVISCCNDAMFFKFTSKMVEQENYLPKKSSKSKKRRTVVNESKHIKPKHLLMGSVLYLMKANPDPLCRINPYIKIDPKTSTIIFDEEDEMLDEVLSAKFTGNTLTDIETNDYMFDEYTNIEEEALIDEVDLD